MTSIIIPAKNEKYLDVTIRDLKAKAKGPIEIIVVLDGVDTNRLDGVTYIYYKESIGMKEAINSGVSAAQGEYIMKIDAHCIVDEGFDLKLIKDHQDNWIQIPRRYKLDEATWTVDRSKFTDYEYWIWPGRYNPIALHGFRWPERAEVRANIMIDDTLTFQGSFWLMTRKHWDRNKFMTDPGYGTLSAQEATYLGNATWLSGGRVVVNKNTWYAHLHKPKGTRGYHMDMAAQRDCYRYSYDHWVNKNKDGFIKLIEHFWPVPGWPKNWKERLWKN